MAQIGQEAVTVEPEKKRSQFDSLDIFTITVFSGFVFLVLVYFIYKSYYYLRAAHDRNTPGVDHQRIAQIRTERRSLDYIMSRVKGV